MDLKTGSSNLSNQDVSLLNVLGEGSAVAVQDEAIEGLVPAVKNLIQSYPQLAGFFEPPVSQDDAIAILNSPHVAGLLAIETGATASAITLENIVRHVEFASVGGQFNTEVFEATLPQLKARSELGQESNPAQQKLVSTMADFAGQIASAQVTLDQAVQQLLVAVDDSPFLQSVLANEDPTSLHVGTPQKSQSLSQALSGLDLPISSSGPNGFSESDVSLESLSATFKSLMGSIAQFSSSLNNSINTGNVSQPPANVANSVESTSTRSTDLPSNAPQLDAENKPTPPPTLPAQTRTEPVAAQQNNAPVEKTTPASASASAPVSETTPPSGPQQITANIERIQKLDLAFTSRTEDLSNAEMREAKKLIKETIQMLKANSAAGNASVLTPAQQTAFADSIVSLNSKVGGPDIAIRGSTTGEITVLVTDPVGTAAETVIAKGKLKDFVPPDDVITSPNTESLAELTADKYRPVLSRTVPATAIEANTNIAGANSVGTRSAELDGVDGTAGNVNNDDEVGDVIDINVVNQLISDGNVDAIDGFIAKIGGELAKILNRPGMTSEKAIEILTAKGVFIKDSNGELTSIFHSLVTEDYFYEKYGSSENKTEINGEQHFSIVKSMFLLSGPVSNDIPLSMFLAVTPSAPKNSPVSAKIDKLVGKSEEWANDFGLPVELKEAVGAKFNEWYPKLLDQFIGFKRVLKTLGNGEPDYSKVAEFFTIFSNALSDILGFPVKIDFLPNDLDKENVGEAAYLDEKKTIYLPKSKILTWSQGDVKYLEKAFYAIFHESLHAFQLSGAEKVEFGKLPENDNDLIVMHSYYSQKGKFATFEGTKSEYTKVEDQKKRLAEEKLKEGEKIKEKLQIKKLERENYSLIRSKNDLLKLDNKIKELENKLNEEIKNAERLNADYISYISSPEYQELINTPEYKFWTGSAYLRQGMEAQAHYAYLPSLDAYSMSLSNEMKRVEDGIKQKTDEVKSLTNSIDLSIRPKENKKNWLGFGGSNETKPNPSLVLKYENLLTSASRELAKLKATKNELGSLIAASSGPSTPQPNPSASSAPLPENEPGSTEVTTGLPGVQSALNSLNNTDSPSPQQVTDLLNAVGELNHTQAAVLGTDEKIQIINLARSAGVEIPQNAMSVLRGSASNFDQPLDSFPQDIQDLISGKSSEASASVAAAVQSDPLMARWFAGEVLGTAELQQVTATLGTIAADTYGLNPPPTVEFNEFADASVEGVYDPATNSIQINPSVIATDSSVALKLSQTIFHEMSHAWQHQLAEQLPPAGQPLDLATAKPEEQLGLLLSASLNSQGSQQFEYLTGWEEKTSFSIGNSVFESVLNLSNEAHGSNFELSYQPRRDETAPGSTERPGYEQTAGGMVMNVTGSHGNAGGSSAGQPLDAVEDPVVSEETLESLSFGTEQIEGDAALVDAKLLLHMNPDSIDPAFISELSAVIDSGGAGTFAEVSASMTDDQLALMFGTAVKAHPDLLAEMTTAIQSAELGPDVASKIVQHHRNTPDVLAAVDAMTHNLMFADWQPEGAAAYTNALMPDSSTNSSFANQPDSVKEVVLGRTYAKLTPEEASKYLMEHLNTAGPVNVAGILSNMPTQQAASLYSHAANTNPELFEKMNADLGSDSKYSGLTGVMNIYHEANTKLESHLLVNMAEVDVYDDPATGQRAFVVRGNLVPRETTLAALAAYDPLGTTEIYFGTLPSELSNLKKTNTLGNGNVPDDSQPTMVKSLLADTDLAKTAGTSGDGSKRTLREEATIWQQAFAMNEAAPTPGQAATGTETGNNKPENMGLPDGVDPDGNTGSIGAINVSADGSENGSSSTAQVGNGGVSYVLNADRTHVLVAQGTAQKVNQNGDLVEGDWQVWAGVVQQADGSFVANENSGLVATFNANTVYGAQVSGSGQLDLNNLNVASTSGNVTVGVGTQATGTFAASKDLVQLEGSFDVLFGVSFDGQASVGGENTYLGVGAEAAIGAVGLGGGAEGSYENGVLHYEMNLGISLGLGIELSTSGGIDLIALGNGARDYFTGDLELTNRKDNPLLNEGLTSVATGEGRDTATVEQLFVLNPHEGYNEVKPMHYSFDGGRSVLGDHDILRLPGLEADWTISNGENSSKIYTHNQFGTTVTTLNVEDVQYYGDVAGVDSQAVNDRAENSGKVSDQEYISSLTRHFEEKLYNYQNGIPLDQLADVEVPSGYPSGFLISDVVFDTYHGDSNDTVALTAHLEDFLANLKVTEKLDGKFYAVLDHASVPEQLPADWDSFAEIPVVANYFDKTKWDSLAMAKLESLYPAGGGNKQEFLQAMNEYFNAFGETISMREDVAVSPSPTDISYVQSLVDG